MGGTRESLSRREFLGGLTVATAAGLAVRPEPAAAEPPPETTRIRIAKVPAICLAQLYLAEELLRGEGFTDVQYVEMELPQIASSVVKGSIDLSAETVTDLIMELDGGGPIVIVGGLHVGCYELVGTGRIRMIVDRLTLGVRRGRQRERDTSGRCLPSPAPPGSAQDRPRLCSGTPPPPSNHAMLCHLCASSSNRNDCK